jgi:hypothetical protein
MENFTHFLPMELNDMEKLVLEKSRGAEGGAHCASAIRAFSISM